MLSKRLKNYLLAKKTGKDFQYLFLYHLRINIRHLNCSQNFLRQNIYFFLKRQKLGKNSNNFILLIFRILQENEKRFFIDHDRMGNVKEKLSRLLRHPFPLITRNCNGFFNLIKEGYFKRTIFIFLNFIYKSFKYQSSLEKKIRNKNNSFILKEIFIIKFFNENNTYSIFFRNSKLRKRLVYYLIHYHISLKFFNNVLKLYLILNRNKFSKKKLTVLLIFLKNKYLKKSEKKNEFPKIYDNYKNNRRKTERLVLNDNNVKKLAFLVERIYENDKIKILSEISYFKNLTENYNGDFLSNENYFKSNLESNIYDRVNFKNNLKKDIKRVDCFNRISFNEKFLFLKFKSALKNHRHFEKFKALRKNSDPITYYKFFFFEIFYNLKKNKLQSIYVKLRNRLLNEPFSMIEWKLLSDVISLIGILVSKTLRFSLRLLKKFPDCLPATLFSANHCSCFLSYGYAQAEYLQAYKWNKTSPFLNAMISIQYLNGCFNRKNLFPGFSLLLSISFFIKYCTQRNFIIEYCNKRKIKNLLYEDEILYNKGRYFIFFGMLRTSFKNFNINKRKYRDIKKFSKKKRKDVSSRENLFSKKSIINISVLYNGYENDVCRQKTFDF